MKVVDRKQKTRKETNFITANNFFHCMKYEKLY